MDQVQKDSQSSASSSSSSSGPAGPVGPSGAVGQPSANEIIIPVECGPNKATLYLSRLCQGSRGPCVLFRGSWLTPNEFQYVSGRETAKDWKRSIRHGGKSLKLLVAKGVMSLNPPRCGCDNCGGGGAASNTEVNKENMNDVGASPGMDMSGKPAGIANIKPEYPNLDQAATQVSSLPGSTMVKADQSTLGYSSPLKDHRIHAGIPGTTAQLGDGIPGTVSSHHQTTTLPYHSMPPPPPISLPPPPLTLTAQQTQQPQQSAPSIPPHGTSTDHDASMSVSTSLNNCTASTSDSGDKNSTNHALFTSPGWPTGNGLPQSSLAPPTTLTQSNSSINNESGGGVVGGPRAPCGILHPTATHPPAPSAIIPAPPAPATVGGGGGATSAPDLPPAGDAERASEAYAYYVRSLQSMGHSVPPTTNEDINSSSYGEFFRRYYQWYNDVNRKTMYPPTHTPAAPLPMAPTPTIPPTIRPPPSSYDPLLHYEYMQRNPYYLSSSFYPTSIAAVAGPPPPHPAAVLPPPPHTALPVTAASMSYSQPSLLHGVTPPVPPTIQSHPLTSSILTPTSLAPQVQSHPQPPTQPLPHLITATTSPTTPSTTATNTCTSVTSLPDMGKPLGSESTNPLKRPSYDTTYLDLDAAATADKQRKLADSMWSSPMPPPAPSSYIPAPYSGLGFSSASYLGWGDRRGAAAGGGPFLDYDRHRHLDPLAPAMLTHSSSPFAIRPLVDACKVLS